MNRLAPNDAGRNPFVGVYRSRQQNPRGLPTGKGKFVEYPDELLLPVRFPSRKPDDPYAYLGQILYTGNSWTARGSTKDINNLLMNTHLPKTYLAEDCRRCILAESPGGLPADIDEDSLAGTAQIWYFDNHGPDRTQNMEIHREKLFQ